MKYKVFIVCLIIFNIFLLTNIIILINSAFNKEKVLIEDMYVANNHYVGNVLTTKGNVYYIDTTYKNNNDLEENSKILLKYVKTKPSKMNKEDFKVIKKTLDSLEKSYNKKCVYSEMKKDQRVLLYYDYKQKQKIILGGKKVCEDREIIDILQKYDIWIGDA